MQRQYLQFKLCVTSLQLWSCFLVTNSFFFPSFPWKLFALVEWNATFRTGDLHFVVPKHERNQFSAQSVLHWRNVPQSRVRWLRGFSFTFSVAICCFAFSVCQSTLKVGDDFQWFLCSLYQLLHPQLLFIRARGYPDLQLSVGNQLWVAKVFLYCLCRDSHAEALVLVEDS